MRSSDNRAQIAWLLLMADRNERQLARKARMDDADKRLIITIKTSTGRVSSVAGILGNRCMIVMIWFCPVYQGRAFLKFFVTRASRARHAL